MSKQQCNFNFKTYIKYHTIVPTIALCKIEISVIIITWEVDYAIKIYIVLIYEKFKNLKYY